MPSDNGAEEWPGEGQNTIMPECQKTRTPECGLLESEMYLAPRPKELSILQFSGPFLNSSLALLAIKFCLSRSSNKMCFYEAISGRCCTGPKAYQRPTKSEKNVKC